MSRDTSWLGGLFVLGLLVSATDAQAQVIGNFRWQFAPFCNVVTMTVEQFGSHYRLTGYDDQCGATVRAGATGTAHLNLDGTAGLAIAVTRPDGRLIQSNVLLNLATVSGAWSDSTGNSGTFVFNPPSPAPGSPRRITIRGDYAINFQAAGLDDNGVSAISFGELLAVAPTAVAANFIKSGSTPTADCPGTPANPEAAPGHLCVYEQLAVNVTADRCVARAAGPFSCHVADRFGAIVFAESVASGPAVSQGTWALTIP